MKLFSSLSASFRSTEITSRLKDWAPKQNCSFRSQLSGSDFKWETPVRTDYSIMTMTDWRRKTKRTIAVQEGVRHVSTPPHMKGLLLLHFPLSQQRAWKERTRLFPECLIPDLKNSWNMRPNRAKTELLVQGEACETQSMRPCVMLLCVRRPLELETGNDLLL